MRIKISYCYNRGGECKTEGGRGGSLSKHMSHHHIIAYPKMYCLGILALVYLKMQENNKRPCDKKIRLLQDKAGVKNNAIFNCLKSVNLKDSTWSFSWQDNSVSESLYRIAWMPINLFLGPSAKLRLDDPGQGNDEIPLSMPEDRRQAIKNIKNIVLKLENKVGKRSIPHNSGGTGLITLDDERDIDNMMNIFFNNINYTNCHESIISDWYIGVNKGGKSSNGSIEKYYASKNASLPDGKRNREDRTYSSKFGVISKENKRELVVGKRYGISSISDTSVNGVIKYVDGTYDTELNRKISEIF